MACEMFWMDAPEPPPAPKRKASRAAARKADDFACDAPEPAATPVKRRAAAKPRRSRTVKSERRP